MFSIFLSYLTLNNLTAKLALLEMFKHSVPDKKILLTVESSLDSEPFEGHFSVDWFKIMTPPLSSKSKSKSLQIFSMMILWPSPYQEMSSNFLFLWVPLPICAKTHFQVL